MKLKTRLFIAFLTVILLPICLTVLMYFAFSTYQIGAIEKTYGIENTTRESLSNSMQVLSRLTERSYHCLLYTSYPDQLQLRLMCKRICERAKEGEEEPGQWFRDLAQVMVCQELCQRRAEYRRYRKTFYMGAGETAFPVDVPERI